MQIRLGLNADQRNDINTIWLRAQLRVRLGAQRNPGLCLQPTTSYPDNDIVVHANDVKSCFRQIKHHPDVAGAFSYILADYLFFQVGLAFGADFSPANWEAV
jgi:hypothetical protein